MMLRENTTFSFILHLLFLARPYNFSSLVGTPIYAKLYNAYNTIHTETDLEKEIPNFYAMFTVKTVF